MAFFIFSIFPNQQSDNEMLFLRLNSRYSLLAAILLFNNLYKIEKIN